MPPVGFEPTISAEERPQTYALDRAATGTGGVCITVVFLFRFFFLISLEFIMIVFPATLKSIK